MNEGHKRKRYRSTSPSSDPANVNNNSEFNADIKWFSVDFNPHLEQCRTKSNEVSHYEEKSLSRVLTHDAMRMPYKRRQEEMKTVVHWGQRKLLMNEIEFLTEYAQEGITCLYAGAAPGTHIPFLSDLFPEIHFVLIDPSDFSITPTAHITTEQVFMTDEIARDYAHMKTLFISDIRSADWRTMNNNQLEKIIARDMSWQMNWHILLNPVASLLKFRLPWTPGTTTYLRGEVVLPVWGPQTTTESRLWVTGGQNELMEYDHDTYSEQMFYFNNITRLSAYRHEICVSVSVSVSSSFTLNKIIENEREKIEGLDFCYDCASEVRIIRNYLRSHVRRLTSWCSVTHCCSNCIFSDRQRQNKSSSQVICMNPSCRDEIARGIRHFIHRTTLACNGKNGCHSSSFRTLHRWRRTYQFREKVYDTENYQIIEYPLTTTPPEYNNKE